MRTQLFPLVALMTFLIGAGEARAEGPLHVVLLAHRVTNAGKTEATSVLAHCVLPVDNRYQKVIALQVDPQPAQERTDREGQNIVTLSLGSVPSGHTRAVRVLAWVHLKPVSASLARSGDAKALDPSVEQAYLEDSPLLQLDKIKPIAQKVIPGKRRDIDQARALYNHMAEHCRYDIDKELDGADAVLEGKPGSCSELAWTYVALCRSVGIPARIVSAYVNRDGTSPSVDWRSHRWAEFYAQHVGWVPVDPTNRINFPSQNFFGRQQGKYLTLVDDGAESPLGPETDWQPLIVFAKPQELQLAIGRSAAWRVSTNRQAESTSFKQACQVLGDPDATLRRQAVEQWDRPGESMRVAFLLEALFDAEVDVRKAAAVAIGRSGDVSVMLALIKRRESEPDVKVKDALLEAAGQLLAVKDEKRRAHAVGELAKSREDDALKLLESIWKDPAREVRKTAAQMLYKFGDKPAVHDNYRELAHDKDEFVRVLAALRWARVGAHEALDLLIGHLESRNSWDREQALAQLIKRTDDDFGFDPRSKPDSRRNRQAIAKFRDWLVQHPEVK